ncbi:hypothetical protein SynA1528_01293 [Synechococcus sp. A15-28]|nr:hypothetical protein SynA1528_01293 [Synechococcus sp. A15-28]
MLRKCLLPMSRDAKNIVLRLCPAPVRANACPGPVQPAWTTDKTP